VQQDAVFEVRVSFLELYNEEIYDLLSVADNNTGLISLHYSNRKGSVLQGQEEVLVSSKKEVYKILERGSAKRRTAPTKLNAHSSRSHTVFTVTVHLKESSVERIGKLNLVDLAGHEPEEKVAGASARAINTSLLSLGNLIVIELNYPHSGTLSLQPMNL